jgi:hypothetical protein
MAMTFLLLEAFADLPHTTCLAENEVKLIRSHAPQVEEDTVTKLM